MGDSEAGLQLNLTSGTEKTTSSSSARDNLQEIPDTLQIQCHFMWVRSKEYISLLERTAPPP